MGLGGLAANLGSNQLDWLKSAWVSQLNRTNEAQDAFRNVMGTAYAPLQAMLTQGGGNAMANFWGDPVTGQQGFYPSLQNNIQSWQQGLPQLFRDSGAYWTAPQQSALGMDLFGNPTGGGQYGLAQLAQLGFNGGGWSPQSQNLFDMGGQILGGQGFQMGALGDIGGEMLGQRGGTALTRAMLANPVGGNPGALTQYGTNALNGIAGTGGLTPTGGVGEGVALQGLLRGGATPYSQFLQQRGAEFGGQEALLPLTQVLSMARNQAATALAGQAEQARRQALARGGGAGSIVANGLQNQGLADWADEAARSESGAITDALMKQQGLQLQQQQLGANMALGAGGLEQARLGTFGNILGGLEDMATRRFGIGGGMLTDANQLALQANQQELQRMGLGGQFLQDYNQNRLGALNALGNILQNQNQYTLGLGGLSNNAYQNIFGNMLGSGQLGNERARDIAAAMGGLFNTQAGMANTGLNAITSTYGPWSSALGNFTNLYGNLMGEGTSMQNYLLGTGGLGGIGNPWAAYLRNPTNVTSTTIDPKTGQVTGETRPGTDSKPTL